MTKQSFLSFHQLPSINAEQAAKQGKDLQKQVEDCLFGDLEIETPNKELDTEENQALTLHTYAILDAAKLPYILTGLLASSGLPYTSLFQGEAQKELEESAPYLVQLDSANRFTQKLLPNAAIANSLWPKSLCVFFRSSASLGDLRYHFRKFTRLRNEIEKWYLFKFWEPQIALASELMQTDIDSPLTRVWLGCDIKCVLFPYIDYALFCSVHEPTQEQVLRPIQLRAADFEAMAQIKRNDFLHRVEQLLNQDHPELMAQTNSEEIRELYTKARENNYTIERASFDYIRCSLALKKSGIAFNKIEDEVDPFRSLSPLKRGKKSWIHINDNYLFDVFELLEHQELMSNN